MFGFGKHKKTAVQEMRMRKRETKDLARVAVDERGAENASQRDLQLEESEGKYVLKISQGLRAEDAMLRTAANLYNTKYTTFRGVLRMRQAGMGLANASRAIFGRVDQGFKKIKGYLGITLKKTAVGIAGKLIGGLSSQEDAILQRLHRGIGLLQKEQMANIQLLEKDVQMQIAENNAELVRYQALEKRVEEQLGHLGQYKDFLNNELANFAILAAKKRQEIETEKDELAKAAKALMDTRRTSRDERLGRTG